ncbi:MAG: TRAP transporter TatT component family protein [Verrucomicrobia bacterium]|nr:TRAP transporter TatT component family protein [Verrucomicrobiota bacterium]
MATRQVADALAASGGTFSSDDDPQLVREAIPFGLKTMESLLAEQPEHRGLLLALASGFTQYAFAFVQMDADEIESQDLAKATAMRTRARKLYLRARDYGLRGLEVCHRDLGKQLRDDPTKAVRTATREDVPLLYWTGASWAAAISTAKSDSKLMAELPSAAALVQRALDLDEAWDSGSLHEFFIAYDGGRSAAMGGSIERARKHFARAVELSGGLRASAYVGLAETVCVGEQKKAEFNQMLNKALTVDPDKKPEWRLLNLVSQRRARWLKEHVDDLFP